MKHYNQHATGDCHYDRLYPWCLKNQNSNTENEKGTLEEKLKKLKGLFDKELITKDEYDTKRLEILDSF